MSVLSYLKFIYTLILLHQGLYFVPAFAKMNEFRKRGQLCDVVIQVGTKEFLAHRVVLAATSDYFDAMFSSGMAESAQLKVELKSISPEVMANLLEYAYTGHAFVSMDNVQDLLPAANLVQMEGVKQACSQFLLAQLDTCNVLGIRRFAELHNCSDLELMSSNYAAHNFESIVDSDEFLRLNYDELLDLISREDLRIDCEETVYLAVVQWLHHKRTERSPHLPNLLRQIRLPVMSVRFITDVVDKDPVIRRSLECRDLVDDAKRFHLRPDLRHEMHERRFRQRNGADEFLVVIGGFGSDQNPSDSVEMFNPRSCVWNELPDLPISYRYVAACSLDTCVYVIGGFDGRDRLNTVWVLDVARRDDGWQFQTPMNFKRGLSSACTHKGLIYVCGGFDGQSRLRSLEVYHPKIDEWRILDDMTTAREGAGLVVVDDTLYCLGGYDGYHLLNSMEAFDIRRGTWSACKPMYMRRSGAGCALLGDTIYVCGGYGGAESRGPLHLDTVEAYNTRLAQWTLVSSMNVPRCYVGACPLGGKIYVAAGYNGSRLLDTVESYDPIENIWWPHECRMNHERCDTGMCVVRILPPCTDPQTTTSTTTNQIAGGPTGNQLFRLPTASSTGLSQRVAFIRSTASRAGDLDDSSDDDDNSPPDPGVHDQLPIGLHSSPASTSAHSSTFYESIGGPVNEDVLLGAALPGSIIASSSMHHHQPTTSSADSITRRVFNCPPTSVDRQDEVEQPHNPLVASDGTFDVFHNPISNQLYFDDNDGSGSGLAPSAATVDVTPGTIGSSNLIVTDFVDGDDDSSTSSHPNQPTSSERAHQEECIESDSNPTAATHRIEDDVNRSRSPPSMDDLSGDDEEEMDSVITAATDQPMIDVSGDCELKETTFRQSDSLLGQGDCQIFSTNVIVPTCQSPLLMPGGLTEPTSSLPTTSTNEPPRRHLIGGSSGDQPAECLVALSADNQLNNSAGVLDRHFDESTRSDGEGEADDDDPPRRASAVGQPDTDYL